MSETLYKRLGGAEGVVSIANDLVDLHLANPKIQTRFQSPDIDLDKLKRILADFLGSGTGGSEEYTGRDMLTAHKNMNLTEEEYFTAMDDALIALERNSIGQREQEEILFILYSFRKEILRK